MNTDSVIFISCFLPLCILLYRLIRNETARKALLLAAGLIFYAFGSLSGLLVLVASALVNFLAVRLLSKGKGGKWLTGGMIAINLALLIAYKYVDFVLSGILSLPQTGLSLAAPLGISFFTFKAISALADLSRKPQTEPVRFGTFLLYLSFFPQVLAGPITRFGDFQAELHHPVMDLEGLTDGLRRFVIGLSKKLLLASVLGTAADQVFALDSGSFNATLAWVGAIAYFLQIYFDFSGYSDMAIGLGRIFGFSTPENFQYPYIADSVGNFWRRWHISLSGWFRDYVYIPLGGNRKGPFRTALHKLIVFTLCGIWHGANWTFLVWGLWHSLFTALESLQIIPVKKFSRSTAGRVLGHVYTLLVVLLGFVLFRAESVAQGLAVIGAMFTGFSQPAALPLGQLLTGQCCVVLAAGAVLCLPVLPWIRKHPRLESRLQPLSWIGCAVLFVLCLMKLAAGGFAPFIYAQF